MPRHIEDMLLPYVLGVLPVGTGNTVEVHLQSCARCTAVLAQTRDEAAQLALALPPIAVPPLLREGLLHATGEVSRFTTLIDPVARELGWERHDVEALFDGIDHPNAWGDAHADGSQWCPLEKREGAGMLRVSAGHPVLGQPPGCGSRALVLQGACRNADGQVCGVGKSLQVQADEDPQYVALTGPDFICLFTEPESLEAPRPQRSESRPWFLK